MALDVQIDSQAKLRQLAMRLAAPGSAPIAVLRLTAAPTAFGPGTIAPIEVEGDGFALTCRALLTAARGGGSGGESLAALRELAISKIT